MENTAENQPEGSQVKIGLDENPKILDNERLPVHDPIKVLRYRTIKKNNALGWWSAVALVEDHGKKQVCFYRWRRKNEEWKRDKKISFKTPQEWSVFKEAVEPFLKELE